MRDPVETEDHWDKDYPWMTVSVCPRRALPVTLSSSLIRVPQSLDYTLKLDGNSVGSMKFTLIDRLAIWEDFYLEMEGPTRELCHVALTAESHSRMSIQRSSWILVGPYSTEMEQYGTNTSVKA